MQMEPSREAVQRLPGDAPLAIEGFTRCATPRRLPFSVRLVRFGYVMREPGPIHVLSPTDPRREVARWPSQARLKDGVCRRGLTMPFGTRWGAMDSRWHHRHRWSESAVGHECDRHRDGAGLSGRSLCWYGSLHRWRNQRPCFEADHAFRSLGESAPRRAAAVRCRLIRHRDGPADAA